MSARLFIRNVPLLLLTLLMLVLAACTPAISTPQAGADPTPEPTQPAAPVAVYPGLNADDILIQLTYEPGFTLPEFQFPFGRTPYFTLLADGRVIYIDENQDFKVMEARLSQEEAAALLDQVRSMGFERLESHTDMCGLMADGTQACIADASTTVMRARVEDGSLREIKNYANLSNGPATYDTIFSLLNDFTRPDASIYVPHAATLFVRIVERPEMSSPADWPLDPAYVERAAKAPEQFTVVALSAEEAAKWQNDVSIDNQPIVFQLDGRTVSAMFVPWLPGVDFSADIAAQFPQQ